MRSKLSMKPTGWFQIGWSADIPVEGVKALRYFGRDLVAFRGKDGTLRVLDGYCEHLGAHLGHGGCVVENAIRCPFHGWEWDGEGRNVRIPYEERPTRARRIRSWPVIERNEVTYLWHDARGRDPLFPVPDVTQDLGDHVRGRRFHSALPHGRAHFPETQVHPQYVVENIVDLHHFRFVHGTKHSPTLLEEERTEWTARALVGFGKRWLDPANRPNDHENTITIYFWGLGLGFNAELTPKGMDLILIATTPVDDDTAEVFGTYWLEHVPADDADPDHYPARLRRIQAALPDDIRIWNHQRYVERAPLQKSEAIGFRELRRWTARFYPDAASSGDDAQPASVAR